MNAKTMLMLATLAAAAGTRAAETWFEGGLTNDWPQVSPAGGSWSNTTVATWNSSASRMDVDTGVDGDPLKFVAEAPKAMADGELVVTTDIAFEPFSDVSQLAVPEGGKGGLVVVTNAVQGGACAYYGLAKGASATNEWLKLEGATYAGGRVKVTVTLRSASGTNITYQVGETVLSNNSMTNLAIVVADKVQGVAYKGTGSVASLSATVAPYLPYVEDEKVEVKANPSTGHVEVEVKDESVKQVEVKNAGDRVIEVPSSLEGVKGVEADKLVVVTVDAESKKYEIPNAAFKMTKDQSTGYVSLDLDAEATVTVQTAKGSEEIAVRPALTESGDEAAEPLVVGEKTEVGVKTIPGLRYQLKRGDSPAQIATPVGTPTLATGARLKLEDGEKRPTAFYLIEVSK